MWLMKQTVSSISLLSTLSTHANEEGKIPCGRREKRNRRRISFPRGQLQRSIESIFLENNSFSVGLLAVYNNALKLEDVERELEFVQNGGQWKPDCIPRKKVITRLNYLGGEK